MTISDITPENSIAPIYLDPTPIDLTNIPVVSGVEEVSEEILSLRESGLEKLIALGLSEDEAKALLNR